METTKSELWEMLKTMTRMRRMELGADMLYKSKLARGFLHLAGDVKLYYVLKITEAGSIGPKSCQAILLHFFQCRLSTGLR